MDKSLLWSIEDLPDEIVMLIMLFVDNVYEFYFTNKHFNRIINNSFLIHPQIMLKCQYRFNIHISLGFVKSNLRFCHFCKKNTNVKIFRY